MSDLALHLCEMCGQRACATVGSSKAVAYRCDGHFFTARERLLLFKGFVSLIDPPPEPGEPSYPGARAEEIIANDKIQTAVTHRTSVDVVEVEGIPGGDRGQGEDLHLCTGVAWTDRQGAPTQK
jgi:hypothetical protein